LWRRKLASFDGCSPRGVLRRSGTSARTSPRPSACLRSCPSRRRSRSWWWRAGVMMCRPSATWRRSRLGRMRARRRARSIATPTLTTTGCCRWRCQRLRSRSTRRASWPRWPLPSAGARQWRRPWHGRNGGGL